MPLSGTEMGQRCMKVMKRKTRWFALAIPRLPDASSFSNASLSRHAFLHRRLRAHDFGGQHTDHIRTALAMPRR